MDRVSVTTSASLWVLDISGGGFAANKSVAGLILVIIFLLPMTLTFVQHSSLCNLYFDFGVGHLFWVFLIFSYIMRSNRNIIF